MKILIIGAGVIGSTYGYYLIRAGHNITFLEKGSRLIELSENGLVTCNDSGNNQKTTFHFRLINSLSPEEMYDYILVTVRYDQLMSVKQILKNNPSGNIVFMLNNPLGKKAFFKDFDQVKIILGFPGAGGKKEYGIIHNHILSP
jgi:2-dehydropantoate 2-reductase